MNNLHGESPNKEESVYGGRGKMVVQTITPGPSNRSVNELLAAGLPVSCLHYADP